MTTRYWFCLVLGCITMFCNDSMSQEKQPVSDSTKVDVKNDFSDTTGYGILAVHLDDNIINFSVELYDPHLIASIVTYGANLRVSCNKKTRDLILNYPLGLYNMGFSEMEHPDPHEALNELSNCAEIKGWLTHRRISLELDKIETDLAARIFIANRNRATLLYKVPYPMETCADQMILQYSVRTLYRKQIPLNEVSVDGKMKKLHLNTKINTNDGFIIYEKELPVY